MPTQTEKPTIRPIGSVRTKVGEGPLWDVAEQTLYFVDVLGCAVWKYTPATDRFQCWPVPSTIGSMAIRTRSGAILALGDGLFALDFGTGGLTLLADPRSDKVALQLNDGKVDHRGRFLVGTGPRSLQDKRPLGQLYSVAADGAVTTLTDGFGITNGPCWSPDGATFYFANSSINTIYAYDYDQDTGAISNQRFFADTTNFGGLPDGATVDADGRLWVAVCGGGVIVAYGPDGAAERIIQMPVRFVASVMFGGPNLDKLYVTTIDGPSVGLGLPPEENGGALFVIEGLGVRGLPEFRYAG